MNFLEKTWDLVPCFLNQNHMLILLVFYLIFAHRDIYRGDNWLLDSSDLLSQGWQSPIPGAGTPIGSSVAAGAGGCKEKNVQDVEKTLALHISVSYIHMYHLVEAEVEGFSKCKGLEGGKPQKHLEGDDQEGGADEGGDDEGKGRKVKGCPPGPWLDDQGGQENAEDNDHAEEMDEDNFREMD